MSLGGFGFGASLSTGTIPAVGSDVPCTMAAWVKPDATADMTVFGWGYSVASPNRMYFGVDASGYAFAEHAATGTGRATGTTVVPLLTWSHIAGVFTSSTARAIFYNGAQEASNTTGVTVYTPNIGRVGRRPDSVDTEWWNHGQIGDIAVWAAALDPWEVKMLAAGYDPRVIRPQALQAYWSFDRPRYQTYRTNLARGVYQSATAGAYSLQLAGTTTLSWAQDRQPVIRIDERQPVGLLRALWDTTERKYWSTERREERNGIVGITIAWYADENGLCYRTLDLSKLELLAYSTRSDSSTAQAEALLSSRWDALELEPAFSAAKESIVKAPGTNRRHYVPNLCELKISGADMLSSGVLKLYCRRLQRA